MGTITITNQYRFYDELLAFLTFCRLKYEPKFQDDTTYYLILGGTHNVRFSLKYVANSLLKAIREGNPPQSVSFELEAAAKPITGQIGVNMWDFSILSKLVLQGLFINYFERIKDEVIKNYGSQAKWPTVWRFAQVVRNSCAHGKIRIDNPKSSPVTWRTLAYTSTDNGRQVFWDDMAEADLIFLMLDMDSAV